MLRNELWHLDTQTGRGVLFFSFPKQSHQELVEIRRQAHAALLWSHSVPRFIRDGGRNRAEDKKRTFSLNGRFGARVSECKQFRPDQCIVDPETSSRPRRSTYNNSNLPRIHTPHLHRSSAVGLFSFPLKALWGKCSIRPKMILAGEATGNNE